jgi:hypothetical protein
VTDTPEPQPSPARSRAPAPLLAATSLVAVEAALVAVQGIAELLALSAARAAMGVTTAAFFLLYGAGLALCAWALARLRSWARAPVVVAQLLQLAVASSFWGGATAPVAIGLALLAVLVLAGVFHPASIAALADDDA